jgi:hypothetical protein
VQVWNVAVLFFAKKNMAAALAWGSKSLELLDKLRSDVQPLYRAKVMPAWLTIAPTRGSES